MRIVDAVETKRWLSDNGLLSQEGVAALPGSPASVTYRVPGDSGKKTALSRIISSMFGRDGESILWVNEYGIWPSSEDRVLFNGFRKSLGESRTVQERPGHVFQKEDVANVSSLVAMVLYFAWGAVIASASEGVMVEISHDEMLTIGVKSGDAREVALRANVERVTGEPV